MVEQRIEFIGEFSELESIDLTNLIETWNYYLEHPLNLNRASEAELKELLLLNEFQIKSLIEHLKNNGKLLSVYELQSIEYWDQKTIEMILPFIEVSDRLDQPSIKWSDVFKYGKFQVYSRYTKTLEQKKGYLSVDSVTPTNSYQGNDIGIYNRFRFTYRNNISLGLTTQKDAGEHIKFNDSLKGFDFNSAHLFFKGGKWLESFALGGYQVEIGQGLNFWSGYAFGKTADVIQIKKTATPIRAYTSSDESRFLRGGAINFKKNQFSLLTFYSKKKIDGTVNIGDNGTYYNSSITQNGLHRTISESNRRKRIEETIIGSDLKFKSANLEIGFSNVYQKYNLALLKDTLPYNLFDFRGKDLFNTSLYYSWGFKNIILFGEYIPKKKSENSAIINGVLVALDKRSNLTLLYRSYGKGFHSFYNNAFSNGSKVQNETGLFIGYTNVITKQWSFNTYLDLYYYPWLKFQVDKPSKGNDFLMQLNFKPSKKIEFYVRYRQRLKEENNQEDRNTAVTNLSANNQHNLRLNFRSNLSDRFLIKTRIEVVNIHKNNNSPEKGILMYQDLSISSKSNNLKLIMRYAMFQTSSFDTRIYAYENNVTGVYSIPSYYSKGTKVYALLKYHFLNRFDFWFRVGRTIYANEENIGSGLEEISGNTKTEINCQIRFSI